MIVGEHPAVPVRRAAGEGLRVLVVQPTGDKMGHYGDFTVNLCQALGKLGHGVTLCTNRITPEAYLREPPAFTIELVKGGELAFAPFEGAGARAIDYYWGYYRNSYRIVAAALSLCRSQAFDAIFITDVEFLVAALLLKTHRASLPPVVMRINAANFSFKDYPGSVLKQMYKVVQREVFRTTLGKEIAACAVLREWHRDRLKAQLRVPAACLVEVIPEGADAVEPPPPTSEARQRLGIDFRGPVFLFFGRLRGDKGIDDLLEAVARLKAEDFRLVIAGSAPVEFPAREVAALVERAGVANKVILRLGYVPDADRPAYFGSADALVLPYARSYRGGSGPLSNEACAYGKPVIATDVSGMGEVIRGYGMGLCCPPGSPQDFAACMREFLAMPPADRRAMGERAAAAGRANSWTATAARLSELFARVVRPGTAPTNRTSSAGGTV